MTIRIGTNVQSLQAQRRLGQATDRLSDVYRRLSTGQRITKASDDAAGLAIAESLSAKSRVFNRGSQNLSDGLSALTIADGAVEALTQIATRIQELAEQGANGSYSTVQRSALDKEAQTLRSEFLRIIQSTSFNGQKLLDGSVQGLQIQAGFGADGALAASVGGKLGNGSFGSAASTTIGTSPLGISTGDFNGDGALDVVALNSGSNTISMLLGDGSGGFAAPSTFSVGSNPTSIAAADFNRDGNLDIATANGNTDTVSVLLGTGRGSFLAGTAFAVGAVPNGLATGDFNGDGAADIATVNYDDGTVSVLIGQGNGGFGSQSVLNAGLSSGLSAIEAGDFNGDGRTDLVTANSDDGEVRMFLGLGNGSFNGLAPYSSGVASDSLAIGDLNGDGNLDLARNQVGGPVVVSFGNGAGGFSSESSFGTGFVTGRVALGDVNGDGNLDIAAATATAATAILFGNGSGNFSNQQFTTVGASQSSLAFGDLNNDGVPDLIAARFNFAAPGFVSVALARTQDGVQPLLPISLKTQADSKQALSIVSNKLELLSAQRGVIGAAQSRLLSGSRAIASQRDEFIAASSRIRDVDMAEESGELGRIKIIQNAATAVMAQANLQPEIALQLLRS